ncbi:SWI/SNF complex subunit SWI3C [Hibiscus syriacus]|uniref:SWI/SNF complex subunit SWI3C n=1 Tax=Hibiscus syriacus TaxID=106335 RepID=A0A6A3BBI1_HIBSY|nr:SWI/SNF complex subunit SWI3C-like [Hibiscus syriacus]KAE8714336.1 SWI/SNF complex subunit SWI3C [Hibiscus syriacus]
MPASSSDGRGRWKRRKRERRSKHQLEEKDVVLEEEEENNNDDIENSGDDVGVATTHLSLAGSSESEVLADGRVRIAEFPSVVKRTVNRPHSSVMAIVSSERAGLIGDSKGHQQAELAVLENVSHGQLQAVSMESPDPEKYVFTPPPIMEGRGVVRRFGSRVHALPMHSDWFLPSTVHRIERQVVPLFFSGKSLEHTPEKYIECRNQIVVKYMDKPEKRITVSDCQRLVNGISDEDLTRIFRFLDHWGIINYCAAAPSHEPWKVGSYFREDSNGEVHVPSDAIKSVDSLIKFDNPKCRLKAADVYSPLSCHDNDASDLDNRIRERLSENYCSSCSQPTPTSYYLSQKEVDTLLCSDCFHDGRFISGHSSIDFVRVESTKDYGDLDGESWSDQETLLLLEAMEIYNDNWNEIAEHVRTKSKAQCILHFLRLPMAEGQLEDMEVPSMPKSVIVSNGDGSGRLHSSMNRRLPGPNLQDVDSESRLPFTNSGNPVMAMVAFLASAVGPRVAAVCAHASLATLSEGENTAKHRSFDQNEAEVHPLPEEKVKAAAKAGLAAASMKAKLFADHEEREIQRLSANIINHQLKRLELKLKQFTEIETLLMKECEQVEKTRQRFTAERTRIVATRFGPAGVTSQMSQTGVASPMANNNISNNGQQVLSSSPSYPSISGYGNQSVHPHLSFMQHQQMLPMGPRLPLTAMQASTSASPNTMFNSLGNTQPTINHPLMRSVSRTSF